MNAQHQCINLRVESRQVKDAILCVVDTALLHRSIGKYNYPNLTGEQYRIGTIGIEEVACNTINLTYVRVNSPTLVKRIESEVTSYVQHMQHMPHTIYGAESNKPELELEFYQKKPQRINLSDDLPWEIWTITLDIVEAQNDEYETMRDEVSEKLSDEVLNICQIVNQPNIYVPAISSRSDLPLIFDTSFPDVQPYLFRLVCNKNKAVSESITDRFGRLVKHILF